MDDFERAVLICCDPEADGAVKQEAALFVQRVKEEPEGWVYCAAQFNSQHYSELARYMCLNVLEHCLRYGYMQLPDQQRLAIKHTVMKWLRELHTVGREEPKYVRNKMAQLLSFLFALEYPTAWPTFFSDILSLLELGPRHADMFLRILHSLDETMIESAQHGVTPEVQQRNNDLKDAMRVFVLQDVANAWLYILTTYETALPKLANSCLAVMAKFIDWVDINLIVNDRFMQRLFGFVQRNPYLRANATDLLTAIVSKGMPHSARVELLDRLDLISLIRISMTNITDDEENEFVMRLAQLTSTIGKELILGVTDLRSQGEDASACYAVICRLLPVLFELLKHDDDGVSECVLETATSYAKLLQQLKSPLTEEQLEHIRILIQIGVFKMKYDVSHNFEKKDDDEVNFLEFRTKLQTLVISNIGRMTPDLLVSYSMTVANQTLDASHDTTQLPFQDVELALRLVYLLYEIIKPSKKRTAEPLGPPLTTILEIVLASNCAQHPHRAVVIEFFEVVRRYELYFQTHPEHIEHVVRLYLGPQGLCNPAPAVRSRLSYLFLRFIKVVRAQVQPVALQIISAIAPLCELDLSDDKLLTYDDQLGLYEAVGNLISSNPDPNERTGLLGQVLAPLLERFQGLLQQDIPRAPDSRTQAKLVELLVHVMKIATHVSKSFSPADLKQGGLELFHGCVERFRQAMPLQVFSGPIRQGLFSFLHRMIVLLDKALLPLVPQLLVSVLDAPPEPDMLGDLCRLLSQLVQKYKLDIVGWLDELFLPIVEKMCQGLQLSCEKNDLQALNDKKLLFEKYFGWIATITTEAPQLLVTPTNQAHLPQILEQLHEGLLQYENPKTQRLCLGCLKQVVEIGVAEGGVPGLAEFVAQIVPTTFKILGSPALDTVHDYEAMALAQDLGGFHRLAICKLGGDAFLATIAYELPGLGWSAPAFETYVTALQASLEGDSTEGPKRFSSFMKGFLKQLHAAHQ